MQMHRCVQFNQRLDTPRFVCDNLIHHIVKNKMQILNLGTMRNNIVVNITDTGKHTLHIQIAPYT